MENVGEINDASLTVGISPTDIVFAKLPQTYLQIANESQANTIGINPTGTAQIGMPGTHTLFPGGSQTFEARQIPTNRWSVVASGASTPVTVWYR